MLRSVNRKLITNVKNSMKNPTGRTFKTATANRQDSSASSASNEELVLVETVENVRLIGINRPQKRNAVNHETAKQLYHAFKEFNGDSSVDAAVLYGEGGTFCAGYDLSEVSSGSPDELLAKVSKMPPDFRPMGPTMMKLEKPVVGAIDGFAVAGGLELAMICDLRIVEETAIMGVFNRRFGVPLIDGCTIRLPKLIGLSRAMDMILTGREITAKTAQDWGLANRIVPTGASLGSAIDIAKKLSRYPKACLLADRNSTFYSTFEAKDSADAFANELKNGMKVFEESVRGAKQFAEEGRGKHGRDNVQKARHDKSKI